MFANLFDYDLSPAGEGLITWSESALSPRQEAVVELEPEQEVPTPHLTSLLEAAREVDRALEELARRSSVNQTAGLPGKLAALIRDGILSEELVNDIRQLGETRDRLVEGSPMLDGADRQAGQAWKIAGELQERVAEAGVSDRMDAEWSLLRRQATPELFRVVRTIWDRMHAVIEAEGLSWAPRLYVKHGYFSLQDTKRRVNVTGCVFRTRLNLAELAIRLPSPPEVLGLGRLFSNPQRWDEEHSQVLIKVDEQLGMPDIGRAHHCPGIQLRGFQPRSNTESPPNTESWRPFATVGTSTTMR